MADTIPAENKPSTEPEVSVKSESEPVPEAAVTKPTDSAAETSAAPAISTVDTSEPVPAPVAIPAETVIETPAAVPPRERELVQDARLSVLRGMFPDFDDSLLQSVLDSVQGNTDRAIDALLGMSDPDYMSEQPPAAPAAPQTQEELDEQLARTLMLEDERSEHAWRAQQQQAPPQRPEPRRQGSSGGSQDKDTMQEIQEQFNKFAETGKKTLGSLFSKVKAKIQEFDQPPASTTASSHNPSSSNWSSGGNAGAGGDTYPYDAGAAPYPSRHEQMDRAQMPAYYDPNGGDEGGSPTRVGYDAAPAPRTATGTSPPAATNAGAPQIDGGKLGMLPKRPVSLLRTSSPPITLGPHPGGGAPPSSDDDDLEYAENPFEEGGKK
ncbi:hypothetical protein B0H19DRAFT_1095430 [Mycena capillaripes]|nr:hypothetical protein B0H19DRAFT_1095430 [Mycena capillaripes]